MNVKVTDLMTKSVVWAERHHTIEHVRKMIERNKISAVPVADADGTPLGIISLTDLVGDLNEASPVSSIMTEKVYSVAMYDDVSTAARIMRNRRIHRVLVTHEQKIVGMLTAFDLLALVENKRFVAKNAPTESTRKGKKRA